MNATCFLLADRLIQRPAHSGQVNWFRGGGGGCRLWPGFGEIMRVLKFPCRVVADESLLSWMLHLDQRDFGGMKSLDHATLEIAFETNLPDWKSEIPFQRIALVSRL